MVRASPRPAQGNGLRLGLDNLPTQRRLDEGTRADRDSIHLEHSLRRRSSHGKIQS